MQTQEKQKRCSNGKMVPVGGVFLKTIEAERKFFGPDPRPPQGSECIADWGHMNSSYNTPGYQTGRC